MSNMEAFLVNENDKEPKTENSKNHFAILVAIIRT